jgi:hypothetical protein
MVGLKSTTDAEGHPYQMRLQDFYYDRNHDKSLFSYPRRLSWNKARAGHDAGSCGFPF